jgi:WhiB family transcriptional regulator, redox-sensing transcriptional regulator
MAMTGYAPAGWREAGACASVDPDLFFPISAAGKGAEQIARARRVCAGCRVRRQCLDFALDAGEIEGIWGGTTPDERIRARREKKTARRRARDTEAA